MSQTGLHLRELAAPQTSRLVLGAPAPETPLGDVVGGGSPPTRGVCGVEASQYEAGGPGGGSPPSIAQSSIGFWVF